MSHDGPSDGVLSSFFSVDDLPGRDRFEAWEASMGCMFDVQVDRPFRQDFTAQVQSYLVGPLMMSRTRTTAHHFVRNSYQLGRNSLTHYLVQWFGDGAISFDEGKRTRTLQPGEILICDLARQTEAWTTDFSDFTMVVPRPLLEGALDDPDAHHMRILPASASLTAAIRQCIVAPIHLNERYSAQRGEEISSLFLTLLARALNEAAKGVFDAQDVRYRGWVVNAVENVIDANLHNSALTSDLIAKELGMSRSKLYQFFKGSEGVTQKLRRKRLYASLDRLVRPSCFKQSIYDIALECGFGSDVAYIRSFRDAFGVSPGYLRKRLSCEAPLPPLPGTSYAQSFDEWIVQLQP